MHSASTSNHLSGNWKRATITQHALYIIQDRIIYKKKGIVRTTWVIGQENKLPQQLMKLSEKDWIRKYTTTPRGFLNWVTATPKILNYSQGIKLAQQPANFLSLHERKHINKKRVALPSQSKVNLFIKEQPRSGTGEDFTRTNWRELEGHDLEGVLRHQPRRHVLLLTGSGRRRRRLGSFPSFPHLPPLHSLTHSLTQSHSVCREQVMTDELVMWRLNRDEMARMRLFLAEENKEYTAYAAMLIAIRDRHDAFASWGRKKTTVAASDFSWLHGPAHVIIFAIIPRREKKKISGRF